MKKLYSEKMTKAKMILLVKKELHLNPLLEEEEGINRLDDTSHRMKTYKESLCNLSRIKSKSDKERMASL